LDQNDRDNRSGRRRQRMEHDAKLAVIGVACGGVNVRNLHQGKQCQQHQAHHNRGYGKRARPGGSAPCWLKKVQKVVTPYFKDTQNRMPDRKRSLRRALLV
jgi:hypothetical protein